MSPDPQVVRHYITACASGSKSVGERTNAVSIIERRLSALVRAYAQRGLSLNRRDRHVAMALTDIHDSHAAPPREKGAFLPEELPAMLETCNHGTRGIRDRASLQTGFVDGLRRSEIAGLDADRDQTADGRG